MNMHGVLTWGKICTCRCLYNHAHFFAGNFVEVFVTTRCSSLRSNVFVACFGVLGSQ